jgi:hypothetical protein
MPRYDLSRCLAQNRSAGYLSCVRCIGITDRCGYLCDVDICGCLHELHATLYLSITVPATRLRLKADTQAEAGGGRVAGGGAELAPDARLQLPFVCHG